MKQLAAGAAIVGAAALVALGSAPAQAEPMPIEPGVGTAPGQGALYLEIQRADGTVDASGLLCPDGLGHPEGAAACGHLDAAGGDVGAIDEPWFAYCTFAYAPVTFRAHGVWEGRVVHWEREFANECLGVAQTGGALFDFGA